MNKVIWNSNGTRDFISGLSDEEKFNTLIDRGYDPDMLGAAENLDDVIADDDYMWQSDIEEFDEEILPMISKQTLNGIVIINGKPVFAEMLSGGDIDPDLDNIVIEDDGEGLLFNGEPMYAIPEDDVFGFITNCLHDAVDDELEVAEDEEDAFNHIQDSLNDLDYIKAFLDPEAVKEFCPRIKNELVEELKEENIEEASTKDRKTLEKEIEEIKPLANDYGFEFFTSMPFANYDNDPQSIEYQYPEFAKVCKQFFKEMGIIDAEKLNDPDELDDNWFTLDQHDWDTIIEVCDRLVAQGGSHQVEKIYKNDYNSPIDDKQVLADREKEAELADEYADEEVEEALVDEACDKEEELEESGETFFEPWDHDDDEDLNATIYLYSQDYDGTPESLQEIEDDLRDHYFYDESDEEFIQKVLNGIKATKEVNEAALKDADLGQQILVDLGNNAFKAREDIKEEDEEEKEDDVDFLLDKGLSEEEVAEIKDLIDAVSEEDVEVEEKEESLDEMLENRIGRAVDKYKRYSGDPNLEYDLSDYAINRACFEEGLSKESVMEALGL